MRRLPVYFLLDTSGSMYGEPIEALRNALSGMISILRQDAHASESVWLSIITFDREVKELSPLIDLPSFQMPDIVCPRSGPTFTGKALDFLNKKIKEEIRVGSPIQKGDWKPLLFLFTDGKPSDIQVYREAISKIKLLNFGAIVGCAAGASGDNEKLKELTDTVVHLETADGSTLKQFFIWVSETIEQGNKSMGTTDAIDLPPPPSDDIIII